MLSSALWVQCIIVVKVSVVMSPPRKCWPLMLRMAIPEGTDRCQWSQWQTHDWETQYTKFHERSRKLSILQRPRLESQQNGKAVVNVEPLKPLLSPITSPSPPCPRNKSSVSSEGKWQCSVSGGNTEEPQSLSVSAPANTELFTQAARVFAEDSSVSDTRLLESHRHTDWSHWKSGKRRVIM